MPPGESYHDPMMVEPRFTCLEFFAGGGLARLGLEDHFDCVFANDIDPMKCRTYRHNFPGDELIEADVTTIDPDTVPDADLAWASFPCQDLSLAGARGGLNGARSGAFWGFWNIIDHQLKQKRAPRLLVLENVTGLISSNAGADLQALVSTLQAGGYHAGAVVLDAAHFRPQSRPRVFIIAHHGAPPPALVSTTPHPVHHPHALTRFVAALPAEITGKWVWWRLPDLPIRNVALSDVIERSPPESVWRADAAVEKLRHQMSPAHQKRLADALGTPELRAGAVYRRIRTEDGQKIQRAEIRYDGLAGCLRTPAGGSSKQLLVVTQNGKARLRPLLAREAARLMGCQETYKLPASQTDGLKVMGDGVCVPAVKWLAYELLAPMLARQPASLDAKAAPLPV